MEIKKFSKKDIFKIDAENLNILKEKELKLCIENTYSCFVGSKIIAILNFVVFKKCKTVEVFLITSRDISKYPVSLIKFMKKILSKKKYLLDNYAILAYIEKENETYSRFIKYFGFEEIETINSKYYLYVKEK